jgi:hypothetical protein
VLKRAISLAIYEGFDKAIFMSDCMSLVHLLNSSVMEISNVGILVDGIKFWMKEFSLASVIHDK